MKFRLRTKILLISLVLLVIPFSGYQYIIEIENYLKTATQHNLLNTATSVANILHEQPELFAYNKNVLNQNLNDAVYIRQLSHAVQLDGYTDDWQGHLQHATRYPDTGSAPSKLSFRHVSASYGNYIYALFMVRDNKIVYRQANSLRLDQSDHLKIAFTDKAGTYRYYLLTTRAPGWVNAYLMPTDRTSPYPVSSEPRIKGEWQETDDGYTIEIRIPASMVGDKLGFAIADVDDVVTRKIASVIGTANIQNADTLGELLRPSPEISRLLSGLEHGDSRIWIINTQRHVLGIAGSLKHTNDVTPDSQGILKTLTGYLFSLFLDQPASDFEDELTGSSRLQGVEINQALSGKSAYKWRRTKDGRALIASASHPVWQSKNVIGAVIVEQTANPIFSLQNQALQSLLNLTVLVFFSATLFLFLFANQLSGRIKRLSQEAQMLIGQDGRLHKNLLTTCEHDEIGDLRRSFTEMVSRLDAYTSYLETLSGKLSHELRTPVAVVKSSLDNLALNNLSSESRIYVERANEGIERLGKIIHNLSEASRLEQALANEDKTFFRLDEVVLSCVEGYRQAFKPQPFITDIDSDDMLIHGSADLIAQMLDKLIDNARQFAIADTAITVSLHHFEQQLRLSVMNKGPLLPEKMEHQLFDQLVSIRTSKGEHLHLGLGLYIVRLIADFHHATVRAKNLTDNSGVEISVIFTP